MTSRSSLFLSVLACLSPAASAQTVVAAHSGVINFFEGSVSVDGQTLEQKFGRFSEIKPGSELRTTLGRAEIMLTPGVMLRVDQNSTIRMVSNTLADTRLEFVGGAAILDSRNAAPGAPVHIAYKDFQMRFARAGRYRMDSDPAGLQVDQGEADVLLRDKALLVKAGQALPFSSPLTAKMADIRDNTAFEQWDSDRSASISADNQSAADSDNLSTALNDPQNASGASGYDAGGYFGGLTPDPVVSGGYYASAGTVPLWLYPGFFPGVGFGYMPLFVRLPAYGSGIFPYRTGTIGRVPLRTYSPTRTWTAPLRTTPRPAVRAIGIGHR
jgi:hypothetical protein